MGKKSKALAYKYHFSCIPTMNALYSLTKFTRIDVKENLVQ